MTVVMITHDDKLGERADRTIRLQDGRMKSDMMRRVAKAPPAPPAGGNGSVAAPPPPATAPIPTVGSGPRPSAQPKSVLPPFAVQ